MINEQLPEFLKDQHGWFSWANHNLVFLENGDCYVKGKLIGSDKEILEALKTHITKDKCKNCGAEK